MVGEQRQISVSEIMGILVVIVEVILMVILVIILVIMLVDILSIIFQNRVTLETFVVLNVVLRDLQFLAVRLYVPLYTISITTILEVIWVLVSVIIVKVFVVAHLSHPVISRCIPVSFVVLCVSYHMHFVSFSGFTWCLSTATLYRLETWG